MHSRPTTRLIRSARLHGLRFALFSVSLLASAQIHSETVEEVVVTGQAQREAHFDLAPPTATRLDVATFDLPFSVDRIDQNEITTRGRASIVDAVNGTTGAVGQNRAGAPGVYSWRGHAENSVATLFDGIRVQNSTVTTRDYDSFIFEAVEIVRGPASSVHGEGALAGAVNYLRKEAFFDAAPSYDAVLQNGSHSSYRLAGGMNAPLVEDRLAVRIDGVYSRQGSDVAGDETRTTQVLGSLKLAWTPNVISTLKIDYFDAERDDAYWGTPVIDGRIAFELSEVNYNNAINNEYEDDVLWTTLSTEWRTGDRWSFRHDVYRYEAERDWRNVGRALWNADTQTVGRTFWEDLAYDHTLSGTRLAAALSGRIDDERAYQLLLGAEISSTDFASPRAYSIPFGLQQHVDPMSPPPVDFFDFGQPRQRARETDLDQRSVFVEGRVDLTARFALQGSLRADDVQADFARFDSTPAQFYSADYDPSIWSLGVVFSVSPNLNLYAQYGRAATPSDSLLVLGSADSAAFDLTEGQGAEIGLKGRFLNERSQFALALFELDQSDIPSTDPDDPGNTIQIGKLESRGIEASIILEPVDTVTVQANVARIDAGYADFIEFGSDRSGNAPPNAPETVANLFVDWRFAPRWSTGMAVRYVSDFAANTSNTIFFPSYTLVDADIRWLVTPSLEISLMGRNLTDEDYGAWATGAGGQNVQASVGRGRSVLATVRSRF